MIKQRFFGLELCGSTVSVISIEQASANWLLMRFGRINSTAVPHALEWTSEINAKRQESSAAENKMCAAILMQQKAESKREGNILGSLLSIGLLENSLM